MDLDLSPPVGAFNSGLLARDRPAKGMRYDYQVAQAAPVARARRIAEVCERHGWDDLRAQGLIGHDVPDPR